MKKQLTLFLLLSFAALVKAQDKDTLEVHKIGDRYFVIVDHQKTDSTIQAAVKAATVPKPFDSHFMVVGLATFGYAHTWTNTKSSGVSLGKTVTSTFGNDPEFEFSPMFLWRHSDKLLLEFEPSFDGTNLGVNWADVSYFLCPGLIARAGYIVLPFGTYNKRLAAGWIDKVATDPIGITSSPVESDWGIELEGGAALGSMKINYDASLTNGFQLLQDGTIQNPGITDNNIGKTITGRFGWLPISNSSLEIGASGLYGKAGDANSMYQNATTYMGAGDIQYVFSNSNVTLNLKGQYNVQYVTRENYANPSDTSQTYSYNNLSMGYYAMAAVRPVSSNKILRNFEFAARYSQYDSPKNSSWESHSRQITAGIDYWLTWRTVLKLTYENLYSSNPDNTNLGITNLRSDQNILFVQFSVQF